MIPQNHKWQEGVGRMKIAELKSKEIINAADGRRMGFLADVDINLQDGRLEALVLQRPGGLFGWMGKEREFIIPWRMIEKIGQDTILVSVSEKYLKNYD